MIKRNSYLGLLTALLLSACSTTEQQVEQQIEILAANPIVSDAWNQAVGDLATIGRPAARQLIAHLNPAYYKGVNYREHRDEIEKVRTGSARALGHIQPRAAAVSLKDRITPAYTDAERLASIWALGEIGFNQVSIDALKKQVEDENPAIRLHTALALVKMNEMVAVDEILGAAADPSRAQEALKGLGGANYFGVPILVQLSASGNPQVQPIITSVQAQLVEQLQDEDPDIRMHSARALGHLGSDQIRDQLLPLLEDPSNLVRFQTATSLAELGQAEGIDFLFSALQNEDPILRTNAVRFLTEVQRNSAEVEKQLVEALVHENPLIRAGAAQVLGQARVASAVPALVLATDDEVAEVRWNAVIALGLMAAQESRPHLEKLRQDKDLTVAYYADWALR
ncbi:MAG: hypothetical protein GKR89_01590 [Candidatus Latescibacteria bacterium]|nr:hypothetical protein [Candidatus Latescibacterota bacterium]